MNRYPLWKYAILAVALLIGLIYTAPNFFGEAPAVQVSSAKATLKLDAGFAPRVQQVLEQAGLKPDLVQFDGNSVKARLADTEAQIRAKDALGKALNPDPADPGYIVALNLLSRSPAWLARLHALPMYLGLDLRGGVHFLMQVDMKAALTRKLDALASDARTLLRDKNIRHAGISREGDAIELRFRERAPMTAALGVLSDQLPDLQWSESAEDAEPRLRGTLSTTRDKTLNSFVDFRGFNVRNERTDLNTRLDGTYELGANWRLIAGLTRATSCRKVEPSPKSKRSRRSSNGMPSCAISTGFFSELMNKTLP